MQCFNSVVHLHQLLPLVILQSEVPISHSCTRAWAISDRSQLTWSMGGGRVPRSDMCRQAWGEHACSMRQCHGWDLKQQPWRVQCSLLSHCDALIEDIFLMDFVFCLFSTCSFIHISIYPRILSITLKFLVLFSFRLVHTIVGRALLKKKN